MASTKVSTTLTPGRWSIEYRTTLHILFKRFQYIGKDEPDRPMIVRIFRHIFSDDLRTTHPNGLSDFGITDDWSAREKAGRSKMWANIIAEDPSDAQNELFEKMMAVVREAVADLKVDGKVKEITSPNDRTEETQDDQQDDDVTPDLPDKRNMAGGTISQRAPARVTNSSEKQDSMSTVDTISVSTASPLEEAANQLEGLRMIRWTDFHWNSPTQAPATTTNFVDQSSNLYRLAGKVYRITGPDGQEEDVMVAMPQPVQADAARLNGLPFVHTYDCFSLPGKQYWYFAPGCAWPLADRLPEDLWKTKVAFKDEGAADGYAVTEAMMCNPDRCKQCEMVRTGKIDFVRAQ